MEIGGVAVIIEKSAEESERALPEGIERFLLAVSRLSPRRAASIRGSDVHRAQFRYAKFPLGTAV